jgi:hypothetical protein
VTTALQTMTIDLVGKRAVMRCRESRRVPELSGWLVDVIECAYEAATLVGDCVRELPPCVYLGSATSGVAQAMTERAGAGAFMEQRAFGATSRHRLNSRVSYPDGSMAHIHSMDRRASRPYQALRAQGWRVCVKLLCERARNLR